MPVPKSVGSVRFRLCDLRFFLLSRRRGRGFLAGGNRFFWSGDAEPGEEWEERRDFEGHLLRRSSDRDRLGLDQFQLIIPGVNSHPAAQRKRRDLVGFLRVELRRGGHQ